MISIQELLREGQALLESAGVPDPELDAAYLLAEALRAPRLTLCIRKNDPVPESAEKAFRDALQRRAGREPLQYILGSADFYGRSFSVGPGVLIPRCDTEALCEHALALVPRGKAFRVLDLCTGSGILAVTIALERPQSRVTACDLSEEALIFARQNAKALKADVTFWQGDLFDALPKGDVYDLIVSNPPYIPSPLLPSLQDEVRREPALALCGGKDGMDFYRRIRDGIFSRLAPGGSLCLEGGDDQIGQIAELFSPYFQETACFDDLSGHPRGVCGKGFRP